MNNYTVELFTLDELCEILMIGRNTAYKLLHSGDLGAFRIGKVWKIPKSGVIEYLQSKKTA